MNDKHLHGKPAPSDEGDAEFQVFLASLQTFLEQQEPIGAEFEAIYYAHAHELYES